MPVCTGLIFRGGETMSTAKIRVKVVGNELRSERGVEGYVKEISGRKAAFYSNKRFWKWLEPEKNNETTNIKASDTFYYRLYIYDKRRQNKRINHRRPASLITAHNTPALPIRKNYYLKQFIFTIISIAIISSLWVIYVSANSGKTNNKTDENKPAYDGVFAKVADSGPASGNEKNTDKSGDFSSAFVIECNITEGEDNFNKPETRIDIEIKGRMDVSCDLMLKDSHGERKIGSFNGTVTNKRSRIFKLCTSGYYGAMTNCNSG